MARQEVIARNLGNLFTSGYKQESGAVDGFSATLGRVERQVAPSPMALAAARPLVGSLGVKIGVDRVHVDFRQGRMDETQRELDVALLGDGFLQVRTPGGDLYFRGGPLFLDADRRLVTAEGYPVLGTGGEEVALREGAVSIAGDGQIAVNGEAAAVLSVVEFAPGTRLAKVGEEFYTPEGSEGIQPSTATNTVVKQGFLEASNVDEVSAMSELVALVRAYQASQRMVSAQDELLGKAINEVGRISG